MQWSYNVLPIAEIFDGLIYNLILVTFFILTLYIASFFEGKLSLFSYIGRNSLTILGTHWPLLIILKRIENKIFGVEQIPLYFGLINTIVSICTICGVLYIINIIINNYYKPNNYGTKN